MEANLVGRRLGEFVVREALSSGGFGMVFRAEQPALAREAVIKVMHTRLRASETLIQRFLREARLASRLDHPFAAHMYAFGAEPDGTMWIAMELVRGTPLDRLLEAQGPVPLERFVPLLERICQVVQTAHDQGIVHRDLKPANVMVLARAGQLLPKLLDLGIAKLSDEELAAREATTLDKLKDDDDEAFAATATPLPTTDPDAGEGRLTEEGAVMGSPLYMAPEQWLDAGATDARTDIYALGVLSYEALTGKPPFTGATRYQIAIAHAQNDAPKLGGEFPPALDAVIARAVAKKPEDRFGSALELAAAFRKASGLVDEKVALPKLADEIRLAVLARAPQPIAQAAGALEAARNAHQARDAVWQLVRVAVRMVAVIALSAHAHVGSRRGDARATDAVRRLRRRALPDAEWLAIARELVMPFAKLRDAYPIPELVDYFTGAASTPLTDLLALRDTSDGGATDDAVRELVESAFPLLERMLGGLAFLADYRLVVPADDGARLWAGMRRTDPARVEVHGRSLRADQPALVDASGLPIVTLWPFVQVHEPARGVGPRLVFLEGTGRRGARLIALPEPFEHEDEGLWDAIGALAEDSRDSTSGQESSPYPGLTAFTADDSDRFFGRERETEELVNRLRLQPLLAVVGPSGAGKSSFVHAGVVPNLPDDWQVISVRPGSAPIVGLAARLGKLGLDPATMRGELRANPASLAQRLHARGKGTAVIVVDQFEELFTLCQDNAERECFVDALIGAARSVDDPVRVIITMRDDFLLHAEALPALRARLAPALHLLTTPGRDDLLRILSEPLRRAGYELDDPALAGEMADALTGAHSALALLSFTASKLWELRDRRFRQLTRKAYVSLGGIGGALARHAESTLEAMLPDERRLVREIFRHAVTAEGTRAVVPRAELDQLLGDDRGAAVIEKLVAARLLVGSEGPTGAEQIEITHEALIEAWPRLVTWRSEDAEGIRLRDQLRTTARQWDERGRPNGLLWRGDALAEYRLWRSRYAGAITDIETAFASASLADASRTVRRRRVLLGTSFAVLAAGILALVVLNRNVTEQRARAEDLAADNHSQAEHMKSDLRESYEAQARQYVLAGDYQRALTYLDAARGLGAAGPAHDLLVAFVASGLTGKVRSFTHDAYVFDARFSPDGTRLLTAGYDHRARIWSVADGRLVADLDHAAGVVSARFAADGSVVTASEDGTAALWDGASGHKLATFKSEGPPVALTVAVPSPDGKHVVTLSLDDRVAMWDRSGKLERELAGRAEKSTSVQFARPCAFSPDGTRVAVGDHKGALRLWDTRTGALVTAIDGHSDQINGVVFSADGTRLATASDDHSAAVWDAATGKLVARVHHDDFVNAVAFSPDGKTIATACNDHRATVWSATTGGRLFSLEGHISGVNAIAYSPDGSQLATVSDDANVMLWDAASGGRVSRLIGHGGTISSVAYDAAGQHIVTASIDKSAIVWSTAPQQRSVHLVGHKGRVMSAQISPDAKLVATGGSDGTARLWDRATGKQLSQLALDGTLVSRVAFSPDGTRLATGNSHGIAIWDPATSRRLASLPTDVVNDLEWSHDGKTLLSASDDAIAHVWSSDGTQRLELRGHEKGIWSAAFSPTEDRVVTTAFDHTARFWRATTGEEIARWNSDVFDARFDPRGELLVGRGNGLEAMIWHADAKDSRPIAAMKHDGQVMDVHWSTRGDFIVTASIDETVRVWDRSGHLLVTLGDGHTHWWRAQFSADDRYIVSAGSEGVTVWELPPAPRAFEELVRCRLYELRQDMLVLAHRPGDCT